MNKLLASLSALALASFVSITARADEPIAAAEPTTDDVAPIAEGAPAARDRGRGLDWYGQIGAVAANSDFAGLTTGLTGLIRRDSLAFGGSIEASAALATRLSVAAVGGWSHRADSGLGVDVLGQVGVHRYDGVGRALVFSDDPGAGATLPFAGVRVRGVYVFGTRSTHFQLGLGVGVDHDLRRVTRTYDYQSTDWWNGSTGTETATHSVGFTSATATLDLGMTIDSF